MIKAIILAILLTMSVTQTFAYTISEWWETIESVKSELLNTGYELKENDWSSAKSSYHIFYDDRMVGYIYATDSWISMWAGWSNDWDVWTFFSDKEINEDGILKYFYKISTHITWVTEEDFSISWENLSYYEDRKNIRLYFKVHLKTKGE